MADDRTLTLYMTSWQKRMVKDFVPRAALGGRSFRDIKKMIVKPIIGRCPVSYKIPAHGLPKGEWIFYLTDEQMTMVGDFLGAKTPISSINVSPDFLKEGGIAFR